MFRFAMLCSKSASANDPLLIRLSKSGRVHLVREAADQVRLQRSGSTVAGEKEDLALRQGCNERLARRDSLCQLLGGGLGPEVGDESRHLRLGEAAICDGVLLAREAAGEGSRGRSGRKIAGQPLDLALRQASLGYARLLAREQGGRLRARVVAAQSRAHQRLRLRALLVGEPRVVSLGRRGEEFAESPRRTGM